MTVALLPYAALWLAGAFMAAVVCVPIAGGIFSFVVALWRWTGF